jgi:hypothetical protein
MGVELQISTLWRIVSALGKTNFLAAVKGSTARSGV